MSDSGTLEALGVRVVFTRLGDRYAHRIEAISGVEPAVLLESLEGTAEEDWPPSPPLQELHLETRPDGRRLALLVGRAGRSHWSLSIEALPDSPRLIFDVACRIRAAAGPLGSAYRLCCAATPSASNASPAAFELAGGWRIGAESAADLSEVDLSPARLIIKPTADSPHRWPQTVRWRYEISRV